VRRVQRDVLRMGALVEGSCWLARKAMFERDLEASRRIAIQDKQIDQLYRQIEVDCVNLMTLEAPVSQDLRLLSALMQLIRDLERIGDYADDLGEIAVKLFPYPSLPYIDDVRRMSDRCLAMLAMSLASLSDLNAETALEMNLKDDDVDSDYETLYDLLVHHTQPQSSIEPVVLLVLAIRHLERMADHATNIGKRVVYIVTGQRQ
jgi:phosphate transport system protein